MAAWYCQSSVLLDPCYATLKTDPVKISTAATLQGTWSIIPSHTPLAPNATTSVTTRELMDSSLPKHLSKAHANFFANIHGLYAVVKATDEQTKGFPKQEQTIERAGAPCPRNRTSPSNPPCSEI